MIAAARALRDHLGAFMGRDRAVHARLAARIDSLPLPLDPDEQSGFRMYHQYRGATANLALLSCHVSVLLKDHSPHPPHTHPEEEILVMLDGEADLILPSVKSPGGENEVRLSDGQFVYYPAYFPHTIRAASARPATYLMFKWRGIHRSKPRLSFTHIAVEQFMPPLTAASRLHARVVFEASTRWLGALHAHVSVLPAGAGYAPHVDDHDAAILMLEGEIEALGRRARPHDVVLFVAGHPHAIRNPGDEPARYIVFEFHRREPLLRKMTDPRRWKRHLATGLRRIRQH
jgi:quercetin dioxygenase-like cupin family protein